MNPLLEVQTIERGSKASLAAGQSQRKKRIFILDDHPTVRQGVRRLIESQPDLEVCGEAESNDEALESLSTACADLAIVDLSLKDCSGIDFIKTARSRFPKLLTLVFSMHGDPSIIERVLKVGANGYVLKTESPDSLMEAIQQIFLGKNYLSKAMQKKLLDNEFPSGPVEKAPMSLLSDRELEVLQILAAGQPISKIACLMHLSIKTIEGYCAHIRKKFGLHNNHELIVEANRRLSGI